MSSKQTPDFIPLNPLPRKGTIGVFAPSTPVDPEKLTRGVSYLESLGYRVHLSPTCTRAEEYIAGSGHERAQDLMQLLENPDIHAVFCTRGGFGSIMMLPHLDFGLIRNARKIIAGFSDVTALQWAILKKAGLITFSAGMVGTDMSNITVNPQFEEHFWRLISEGRIDVKLDHSQDERREITGFGLPGTMSVGAMLMGSDYFPDTTGSILILEDVDEPRHKVEAYLQQYRLAGIFDKATAVITGRFSPAKEEQYASVPDLDTVFARAFEGVKATAVSGIDYGHVPGKISLPVGAPLSLSLGPDSILRTQHPLLAR